MLDELPNDALLKLAGYLSVPEVTTLAQTCRSTNAALSTGQADDLMWQQLALLHGADEYLPFRKHRTWRTYLKSLYGARRFPLSGCASVYAHSGGYYCVCHAVTLTRERFTVDIHERGDGRLGRLQPWQESRGSVTLNMPPPAGSGTAASTARVRVSSTFAVDADASIIEAEDINCQVKGSLTCVGPQPLCAYVQCLYGFGPLARAYSAVSDTAFIEIAFCYGSSGYRQETLLTIDRAFIAQHRLAHLFGISEEQERMAEKGVGSASAAAATGAAAPQAGAPAAPYIPGVVRLGGPAPRMRLGGPAPPPQQAQLPLQAQPQPGIAPLPVAAAGAIAAPAAAAPTAAGGAAGGAGGVDVDIDEA